MITTDDIRQLRKNCDALTKNATDRLLAGYVGVRDVEGILAQVATLGLICEQICEALIDGVQSGEDD